MTDQFVTFTAGDHTYGIRVDAVQEVLPDRTATRVPLAPATVSGLINLRGQVVLALDLRARLGLPPLPPEANRTMVVVRHGDEPVSLVVDQIGDVAEVDDSQFEPPPQTLDATLRPLIRGAYKQPDQLLLALDVGAVCAA